MTRTSSFATQRARTRRGGFTLFEILVVLAIAAVVTGITVGGFKEMRAGNKRVACATNLSQIYQAARLYAADEDGKFPVYETDCTTDPTGIGLWALYTFPRDGASSELPEVDTKPIDRYVRSSKVFNCPAHLDEEGDRELLHDGSEYNPEYLSYQTCDDGSPTYASSRTDSTTDLNWQRQLIHYDGADKLVPRQPTGDTIVTYCIHHRHERGKDNVLFYDGSIQQIEVEQKYPPGDPVKIGWQRVQEPLP